MKCQCSKRHDKSMGKAKSRTDGQQSHRLLHVAARPLKMKDNIRFNQPTSNQTQLVRVELVLCMCAVWYSGLLQPAVRCY